MKILHEVNQLDIGGVEKVIRNIIKHDNKNEHSIVSYRDGAYRDELEKAGAKIFIVDKDDMDLSADVVHIHTGGDDSKLARYLGVNCPDLPIIETIHSPVRSRVSPKLLRKRIGVCKAVADMNENCEFIYNGLDINDFDNSSLKDLRSELGISPEAIVVGRLGRLGRDKGIEEWMLTVYRLQQAGHDIVPLIVGSSSADDTKYYGRLRLMAESLPLKNVVWVSNTLDIYNHLAIMDIFLYPSPTEGFGLVFAEAMLAGCLVVTYKTPVTWELFAGYAILTEKSIPALVDGVIKALKPDVRSVFSGLPYDFVRSDYNAEEMSQQYQELYERCHADSNVGCRS